MMPVSSSTRSHPLRTEEDARAAAEAAKAPPPPPTAPDASTFADATYNETADCETTFTTSASANTQSAPPKAVPKKKGKPKLTPKEKKERMVRFSSPVLTRRTPILACVDGGRKDYHVSPARVPRQ